MPPEESGYQQHSPEILMMLGRMDGKLDAVISYQTTQDRINERNRQAQEDVNEKLTSRISSLERWKAYMLGLAAAIGAASGKTVQFLTGG